MNRIVAQGDVRFVGLEDARDASGIGLWNSSAIVVTDEAIKQVGNAAQIFEFKKGAYRRAKSAFIPLDDELTTLAAKKGQKLAEMDLEGVAVDGNHVYLMGSHSCRRGRVDETLAVADNRRKLLGQAELQPGRDVLLKLELDGNGEARRILRTSLSQILEEEPFRSFRTIPSKENGVDVEGLAFYEGHLFAGFRGPILRGNYVPVLKFKFDTPIVKYELLFVNLGGRGIRDLTHVTNGLLILAGPMGDGPGSYQVYFWNGRDALPGRRMPRNQEFKLHLLGKLPLRRRKKTDQFPKAEGIALISETSRYWNVLVIFDGLKSGKAKRFQIARADQ